MSVFSFLPLVYELTDLTFSFRQSMMTPIMAVIILIMSVRRHLQLRLDAMVMMVGTMERDRMCIVVMRGRFLFSVYCLVRYSNIFKEYNEILSEKQWFT